MTSAGYGQWSGAARVLARLLDTAVRAARAQDAEAFTDALADLRRGDPEVVAVVAGAMAQSLLERLHPDGLDADDAEQVLAGVARDGAWWPRHDPDAAALALLGALGVHPDDPHRVDTGAVPVHGLLLVASLLPAERDLPPLVDASLRELQRAQTIEAP